jgi:hypothetical protein
MDPFSLYSHERAAMTVIIMSTVMGESAILFLGMSNWFLKVINYAVKSGHE